MVGRTSYEIVVLGIQNRLLAHPWNSWALRKCKRRQKQSSHIDLGGSALKAAAQPTFEIERIQVALSKVTPSTTIPTEPISYSDRWPSKGFNFGDMQLL